MHAYIISGGDGQTRAEFMHSKLDSMVELIHLVADKSSITIKQVQELIPQLSTSPRLPRIVWIEEANLLTIPAQNALLKMLEEPPLKTQFYLTTQGKSSLLPTILSRTTSVALQEHNTSQDPSILKDLKLIMAMSPGDRINSILKRDRSESLAWISQIEQSLKLKLADSSLSQTSTILLSKIAKLALAAHAQLLANCSVSLVTQNFYLLLPHTRSVK